MCRQSLQPSTRDVLALSASVNRRPITPPAEETWSVLLRGEDLQLLEELARARNTASPDAFGPMEHRPNIIADAVALGLRELARRRP